jgi:hypothetical protein
MAYIVHNLTNNTIVLSDLRAEIGPSKILDLEKVASHDAVVRSYDLKLALSSGRLRLCNNAEKKPPQPQIVEKIVEHHHHHNTQVAPAEPSLDADKLLSMMEKLLRENNNSINAHVAQAVNDLKDQIAVTPRAVEQRTEVEDIGIDPQKLAELKSKAIDKMTDEMETNTNTKMSKKVSIKANMADLADELN